MHEVASRKIHQIPADLRANDSDSHAERPDPLPEPAYSGSRECYAQRPERWAEVASSFPKFCMGGLV